MSLREKLAELHSDYMKEVQDVLGISGTEFFARAVWRREKYVNLQREYPDRVIGLFHQSRSELKPLSDEEIERLINEATDKWREDAWDATSKGLLMPLVELERRRRAAISHATVESIKKQLEEKLK